MTITLILTPIHRTSAKQSLIDQAQISGNASGSSDMVLDLDSVLDGGSSAYSLCLLGVYA